ncbi:MAG: bacterioferritin [Planctomycetaceae bacterium]|nr:ferritin-like domain-containing protein [Planctomycetota bacterium]NUN53239.1 bacterioferritin [Planctomycetaceae bacterium]
MPRTAPRNVKAIDALQAVLDAEMSGVALYTHLSFRVFGPQMQGIITHLRTQAAESLTHALAAGDRMTRLGAVPAVRVPPEIGHEPRSLEEVLRISLVHERNAVDLYRALMAVAGEDVPLEEYARSMVATESDHASELELMLRPMA